MNPICEATLGSSFVSLSQKARVVTENWFGSQSYCLACNSASLDTAKPNDKARDFTCPLCRQSYELKSSSKVENTRVVDGAYATMLQRIRGEDAPVLVLLRYLRGLDPSSATWLIDRVTAIHPVFLTDAVVEARRPLSMTARRAGWQGCNLRIDRIPQEGRIALIDAGKVATPTLVRALYKSSTRLYSVNPNARGWTATVLRIMRDINQPTFKLSDVYARQKMLRDAFPNTRHIEAKVRRSYKYLGNLAIFDFPHEACTRF